MLIGIDASRAVAAERTGTENYSIFLIRALLEMDEHNRYCLYFNRPPEPGLFAPGRHTALRVMPFPRLWTHVRLSVEMAARPPDVLFVPAHVIPLIHPRCSVVTVHDLGYLHYPQAHTRLARWYLQWSTAHNVRVSAHVIADSEATRRDLIEFCQASPDHVTVVYPGLEPAFAPEDDPEHLAAVRRQYGLPETYVLSLGTLQPRKNLTRLVDALAALRAQGHTVHLALAGKSGWLHQPLFEQVRQLDLQDRVHFLGYVPREHLPTLISAARAFALPSLYEGFGFPVLEAMACGTPVLCSDVSSLPEVVGDAGILLNPQDTAQWVEALQRVLDDDTLCEELAQRGRRQAQRFSWQKCAQETLAVLEGVAKPRSAHP